MPIEYSLNLSTLFHRNTDIHPVDSTTLQCFRHSMHWINEPFKHAYAITHLLGCSRTVAIQSLLLHRFYTIENRNVLQFFRYTIFLFSKTLLNQSSSSPHRWHNTHNILFNFRKERILCSHPNNTFKSSSSRSRVPPHLLREISENKIG